jgi:lipopolysaccharide export system permease protein
MILRRYLQREIFHVFLSVYFLLLLVYVSNRFVEYLAEAAAGKIGIITIFKMMGLKLVTTQVLTLPLSLYLASYFVLLRMYRDKEVVAMTNTGLGTRFLLHTVFQLALFCAAFSGLMSLFIAPWAEGRLNELKAEAKLESEITGIFPGKFKEFNKGERILYVEEMSDDRRNMRNVFLQVRQEGKLGVLTSDEAHIQKQIASGDRFVIFERGRRYIGVPGQKDYSTTEYESYGVRIELGEHDVIQGASATSSWQLLVTQRPATLAELQWRISIPLCTVLLACVAVTLIQYSPPSHHYLGLLTAVVIYFTYSNLLGISRTLITKGTLSVYIGVWWVHGLVLALLLGLFFSSQYNRRLWTQDARFSMSKLLYKEKQEK